MVTAKTDNLSVEGFYCTAEQPFSPGDSLACDVFVPPEGMGLSVILHRRVKVLRVEIRGLEPGFGIACQFEDRPARVS
jgi:hypothetical protein